MRNPHGGSGRNETAILSTAAKMFRVKVWKQGGCATRWLGKPPAVGSDGVPVAGPARPYSKQRGVR